MAATPEELLTIRNQIIIEHGYEAATLASMAQFFFKSTAHMPEPMRTTNLQMLTHCIKSRLRESDVTWSAFIGALTALTKAEKTLQMLNSYID